MAIEVEYVSDQGSGVEKTKGSDGRLNVSARTDERRYYSSRDDSQAFSLTWQDASTATGDYVLYWQNTATDGRHLVIDAIGLNSQYAADFELWVVTGTAAGGVATAPVCMNRAVPKSAAATARTADSSTVSGLTEVVRVDIVTVGARGHEEFRLADTLRLGQDQALAVKCDLTDTSPGKTHGVCFGFYE